jgi:hypothetical protein
MKAKMLGGIYLFIYFFRLKAWLLRCHSFDFAGLVGAIINMNFESFDFSPFRRVFLCVG